MITFIPECPQCCGYKIVLSPVTREIDNGAQELKGLIVPALVYCGDCKWRGRQEEVVYVKL